MTEQYTSPNSENDQFRVFIFNVGQGDHTLIQLPNGEFGIIDFHYDTVNPLAEPPGLTYLRQLTYKPILAFIHITHYHADHTRGMAPFFRWVQNEQITVRYVWLPGAHEPALAQEALMTYLLKKKIDTNVLNIAHRANRRLDSLIKFLALPQYNKLIHPIAGIRRLPRISKDVFVVSLAPNSRVAFDYSEESYNRLFVKIETEKASLIDRNLVSTVLMFIVNKRLKLIFGGDAGIETWEKIIDEYFVDNHDEDFGSLHSVLIKASHHGSKYSSYLEKWQEITMPDKKVNVIISAGKHNKFGHPHPETIEHIILSGVENGNIHITFDPLKTLSMSTKKFITQQNEDLLNDVSEAVELEQIESFTAFVFELNSDDSFITKWL